MSGVASKIAHKRARAAGLGSIHNPVKFADQDFETLKAEHLASGTLFEDPKFPVDQGRNIMEGIVWKRPKEINNNAAFIVGGAGQEDIRQGKLGDCWFLVSIGCLTRNQDCLHRVVPQDQSFQAGKYAGIFHFLFWQYGQWVDVVVDDRLPTKNNKLLYVKSSSSNEFWSALLEKAYAKINGSYGALKAGFVAESMEDFTGGVCETFQLNSVPEDFFQKVQKMLKECGFVSCTSKKEADESIVTNHAYNVTGAQEVTDKENNKVQLLRLWNPWGFKEWTGDWSDKSKTWDNVDPKVREELNIQKEDGETWISYSDFRTQFYRLEVCDASMSKVCCADAYNWCLTEFSGSWKKGSTAGGKLQLDTFWMNPQFRITLASAAGDTNNKCPTVVTLMQKDRRKHKVEGMKNFHIGYYIYKVNPSDTIPLGKKFFKDNQPVERKDTFSRERSVTKEFDLLPGDYVVVVSTFYAHEEADFYLRVFSEKPVGAQEAPVDVLVTPFEPIITPDTEPEFDIVKEELQKGEFDAGEVKNLLNKLMEKYPEIKSGGFSEECVRQLIKLMDRDNTGTLSTEELKKPWLKVKHYMKIFKSVDVDNTGTISAAELRNALKEAGITLTADIIEATVERFMRGLELDFVELVCCLARLETVFYMFKTLDPNNSGSINLSASEWLHAVLA